MRVFLYSAYKFNRVTMRFGRQTSKFSEIVWKCQMTVPAVVVLVEGRSTGGDRRLRRFCHPVCCVCAVRADSAIHWNPTAAGDGRHPTAGSSHQRGTQGSLQQVTGGRVLQTWTQSVVGLAASAAPVWCGRADERLRPGAQQRSAPTANGEAVRRWYRTVVSCSSPGDMRWTPGPAS